MGTAQQVTFYLEDGFLQSAQAGQHNFINKLSNVLISANLEPVYAPLPHPANPPDALSLTHMSQPPNDHGLVFRRVYHYPFWQIDAVAQRWQWDVAKASFDPDRTSQDARRFYRFWQNRLFGDAAGEAKRGDYIYVPLQGHLTVHRPFQSCTPIEMLRQCLLLNPGRRVVAALHPKERYGAADRAALSALRLAHPRLEIDTGNMEHHLAACDFVVTQNSGVAFSGYFFAKPALLFARIDFHHIAVKADMSNLRESFDRVANARPPFAEYVWWFWQDRSINAGRPDAEEKIAARLRRFGWPIQE